MILVIAFEAISIAVIGYVSLTQILIPIYRGTQLFPMFRREGQIKQEIAQSRQELEEAKLQTEKGNVDKEKEKEQHDANATGTDSKPQ